MNTSRRPVVHPEPAVAYRFVKRTFDVCSSGCALVVLSPVLLACGVAVKATSPGPIIFKQQRFGRNKKLFTCYKFRSMKVDTDSSVPTSVMNENPDVMTPIGGFIRKWSLDELPQLVNIIKGDMSVIGPRPMIVAEYDQIEARDLYGANDIRPGLSGWAQVHGRDEMGVEDKARFDGWYRKNMSIALDARTIVLSVVTVVTRNGYAENESERSCEKKRDSAKEGPGRQDVSSASVTAASGSLDVFAASDVREAV